MRRLRLTLARVLTFCAAVLAALAGWLLSSLDDAPEWKGHTLH